MILSAILSVIFFVLDIYFSRFLDDTHLEESSLLLKVLVIDPMRDQQMTRI